MESSQSSWCPRPKVTSAAVHWSAALDAGWRKFIADTVYFQASLIDNVYRPPPLPVWGLTVFPPTPQNMCSSLLMYLCVFHWNKSSSHGQWFLMLGCPGPLRATGCWQYYCCITAEVKPNTAGKAWAWPISICACEWEHWSTTISHKGSMNVESFSKGKFKTCHGRPQWAETLKRKLVWTSLIVCQWPRSPLCSGGGIRL